MNLRSDRVAQNVANQGQILKSGNLAASRAFPLSLFMYLSSLGILDPPLFIYRKMVDQPEYGTNCTYYVDFIPFHFNPKLLNFDKIRSLYLEEGLSAAEIARQYGTVKSVILSILHRMGVRLGSGGRPLNDPEHYRCKNPPYGFAVKSKKLVINKAELRLCRTIVELVGRQNMNTSATAKELIRRGFKNRAGRVLWDHKTVKLIFDRWKDKI